MKKIFGVIGIGAALLLSCSSPKDGKGSKGKPKNVGQSLMQSKCVTCHSPKASKNGGIAPPLAQIKDIYKKEYKTESAFVQAIVEWNKKPKKSNSLMPEAIERYGIMAPLGFSKDKVGKIARYMYRNELKKPDWYKSTSTKAEKSTPLDSVSEIGMKYIRSTKKELGKNLIGKLNSEGPLAALEFCSVNALPIMNKKSSELKINIKRVSDKNRNKNNKATGKELDYIQFFKDQVKNGKTISPKSEKIDGKNRLYYPIVTNSMCLTCHGEFKKDIPSEIEAKLHDLYPLDLATGYKENQVRGIWVVDY
jgi:mono/diheme cytochrome c family protein